MAKFKLIISSSEGTTNAIEVEGANAQPLVGAKLGDTINGTIAGLSGKTLRITGGSDVDGFPIRPDVHGGTKKSIILSGGTGFNPKRKGERRRKAVRGNTITENIYQINLKIID